MSVSQKIGFLGAGAMAEALLGGWVSKGVVKGSQVYATDPNSARKPVFEGLGANFLSTGKEVCDTVDILVVATKPQTVATVLSENAAALKNTLVVSIAAGKTLQNLIDALGNPEARVVRVMPNTPCMVGACAAAFCTGGGATEEDAAVIRALFEAVGVIEQVPEYLLSAVTGLSGSGPAYIYLIIESLADGGVRAGLPRASAMRLAAQTVLGGAKMVLDKEMHPGALKDLVTSPGGTTIAGVHSLERSGLRAAMMDAVTAAAERADELSKL
eukprot:jgi/Ulvmu1/8686/UM047_0026.1